MRLSFDRERVLAVLAHPDDEFLCAGTLARAKADGAAIGVCVLCRGDKGQPEPPLANLAEVRRAEMAASVGLLGAELLFGDFGDGELFDRVESRAIVIERFRQFRPSLVLAHAASDYHADHRAASALAEAASWFSASPGHHTASPPLEMPPAVWWLDTVDMHDFNPHFYVDTSEQVELKQQMLRCHRSQLARGSNPGFSPLEDLATRQAEARGVQSGVRAAEAFRLHRGWKRVRAW
ncbi:MAG TPA: PIG-L deacetylase family protein [Pirellulales bacterium]